MTTGDHGLLSPGSSRAKGQVDDATLVATMVTVEVAWLRAVSTTDAAEAADVSALAERLTGWRPDLDALALRTEAAGNPVVPVVEALRAHVGDHPSRASSTWPTSQDVLDIALVLSLPVCDVEHPGRPHREPRRAGLADRHRRRSMTGRTLTQFAVPITLGPRWAQWMSAGSSTRTAGSRRLAGLPAPVRWSRRHALPGGRDGSRTRSPWRRPSPPSSPCFGLAARHTNRAPVTWVGDAVVTACDALGVIAADVSLLSRPELGEVSRGVGTRP